MSRILKSVLLLSSLGLVLSLSTYSHAQVLDAPDYFTLPPPATAGSFSSLPDTLDAGEVDPSVITDVGDLPLNDIVLMGETISSLQAGTSPGTGRVWTLIHTSGSDTQALALATPVDVAVDFSTTPECYNQPTSLHLQDLNGDNINDLAFLGACQFRNAGFGARSDAFGIQGNSSEPFQSADSLILLGGQAQGFAPRPYPPSVFGNGSQLALVNGNFDGDGVLDLAFYDINFDVDPNQNLLVSLLTNGSLGPLPDQISQITGPIEPPDFSRGQYLASGDFDGNGTDDVAVAYVIPNGEDLLFAYSGNGDGTFQINPLLQVNIGTGEIMPLGLAAGNFDDNTQTDFVISAALDPFEISGDSTYILVAVLCSPGNPNPTCTANTFLSTSGPEVPFVVVTADFNGDGFDDIANISNVINIAGGATTDSQVEIRLNNQGGFNSSPDQTLTLDETVFPGSTIIDVIAKDIDACGGPDLVYTGEVFEQLGPAPVSLEGGITAGQESNQLQAAVAFNPNEAPVANAGPDDGQLVGGQVQIGGGLFPGNPPTCSDPTNDTMEIAWVQTGGPTATLNNPTVANPTIISNSGGSIEFTVTCTDACGLSDSDTVTISAQALIEGSGCSLNPAAVGSQAWGAMILALSGTLAFWRKKRS